MNVNDGNGLFDSPGLIDSLIVDCNELPQALFEHQNVRFCNTIVQMYQKLKALKDGVASEIKSRDEEINKLKSENKDLWEKFCGTPVHAINAESEDGKGEG